MSVLTDEKFETFVSLRSQTDRDFSRLRFKTAFLTAFVIHVFFSDGETVTRGANLLTANIIDSTKYSS